jgi:hypothetical protein
MLVRTLDWIGKPFVGRNVEHVMEQRGAHTWFEAAVQTLQKWASGDMLPAGFWWGVFLTLAIWGSFELAYAWRRRTAPGKEQQAAAPQAYAVPPLNSLPKMPLERVEGKFFFRERVLLDGHMYVRCRLKECTLVFNGHHGFMSHCVFEGGINLTSNNAYVDNAISFLNAIGFLSASFLQDGEIVPPQLNFEPAIQGGLPSPQPPPGTEGGTRP